MTVSNEKLEQVSALIDGELSDSATTIDLLLKDERARDAWTDMHFSRDVASASIERKASAGFAAGVMAALETEPTVLAPVAKARPVASSKVVALFRPVAGLAIAATVAAVTIFSFDNIGTGPQANSAAVIAAAPVSLPAVQAVPVAFTGTYDASDRTYWQGSDEGMQDELNRYLVDHSEYSNPGGYQSMVNYVRVAGYDSNQ